MPSSATTAAFVVTNLYPRSASSTFDTSYYLSKHIPLAKEIWGKYEMTIHSISESDAESGYHLSIVIDWVSKDGFDKAQQDERTKEIWEDIGSGRFTNVTPVVLSGNVL